MSSIPHTLAASLQTACAPFSDARVALCRLEIAFCDETSCTLSGEALDRATLDAVLNHLASAFPDFIFRTDEVRILRQNTPHKAVVATNVAGVYAQTSFYSELLSQVMAGWRLEILKEQEDWAFVRQKDGYLGWIYRRHLAAEPTDAATHLVSAPVIPLHEAPDTTSSLMGRLAAGAFVTQAATVAEWARLRLPDGSLAWTPAHGLRALDALPATPASQHSQMIEDALRFVGLPYVWGGGSGFGIDCSGFARLIHLLSGVTIPRDADMQFRAGQPVDEPFHLGDLLFFKSKGSKRIVTHVGLSLGGWKMIHSSISHHGVYIDDVQQTPHLRETFAGARTFINPAGN